MQDLSVRLPVRLIFALGAAALWLLVGSAALTAQTPEDAVEALVSGQLDRQVAEDPAGAVGTLDALIPGATGDPRLIFDLVALKAEALAALGDTRGQAESLRDLGALAVRHRDVLGHDPIAYFSEAAAIFARLDEPELALALEQAILAELELSGADLRDLARAHVRIARAANAAGDSTTAERAASAAENLNAGRDSMTTTTDSAARNIADGFDVVEVFYATDRARTGNARPSRFYGHGRGTLDYGTLEVTIPKSHRAGALEAPSIWKLEFSPNPSKHIVLRSVEPSDKDAFFAAMTDRFTDPARTEAVVFVHGYNVTFENAAKRTAQIAYDLGFNGVPILYSWPSRGSTAGYIADTAVVRLSGRRLAGFLEDVVARSGATTVHLVAHSMGNRALTDALELFALKQDAAPPAFGQIVFAAPDLDAGLFSAMIPTIRPVAERITLYGSEADWALVASRKLHGDAPRAGQGGEAALALADVDTIDMSELGDDMLAHSYIANESSVLLDLVSLFWRNADPDLRCGVEPLREAGAVTVWKYVRGQCSDAVLLGLLATLRHDNAQTEAEVAAALARVFDGAPPPDVARVIDRLIGG